MGCIDLAVPIEILLCTPEKTPPELISQLWKFREEVIKHLADITPQSIHPNLNDLDYQGASALESIEWKVLTEYNDNKEVMVNIIAVKYLLKYSL